MTSKGVAFVTGASRGIGAAAAIALAHRGYDVAVSARTVREGSAQRRVTMGVDAKSLTGSLDGVIAAIEAAGRQALAVPMNLTDRKAVAAGAQAALNHFGRCDILCNIGVYQEPGGQKTLLEAPLDDFVLHFEADVLAPAILCRAFIPSMIAHGGGKILNMSSHVAASDPPGTVNENGWGIAYAAAKGGIDRFAGVINAEHRHQGIVAFTGEPGFVALPDIWQEAIAKYPNAPVCPPEAVGEAVAWVVTAPEALRLVGKRIHLPAIAQKYELLKGWGGPGSPWPV